MPRGWLKHKSRRVGGKVSRGGSSHFQKKQKARIPVCPAEIESPILKPITKTTKHSKAANVNTCNFDGDDYTYYGCSDDDFDYADEYFISSSSSRGLIMAEECPICCETRPLVALMKNCNHSPACRECLHEIYVNQAQQDVKNYPLECYHPTCKKEVSAPVLKNRSIFYNEGEVTKHHRFSNLAKAYRGSGKIVHCPHCDCPKEIHRYMSVKCGQCQTRFEAVHDQRESKFATIDAIQNFVGDSKGRYNGWAHCPRCKITISKGDGCDHMTCPCGEDFNWDEELKKNEAFLKTLKVCVTITTL
mmetsp:Transcript_21801/g.33143  ORF Transcript_21801/g.33143 Transcript_21801/m.33143 type:complete len:303 (-) Transcript_21801:200-1108(-)